MQQSLVAEVAEKILSDLGTPRLAIDAQDDQWRAILWSALEESFLPRAWVPEAQGGAGTPLTEGFEIATVAGRFALPVPLVETLLSGWLLAEAGIAVPGGMLTIAPCVPGQAVSVDDDGRLNGSVTRIPFARDATHVAVLADGAQGPVVALVATEGCVSEGRHDLTGDPRDGLMFDGVTPIAVAPVGFGTERLHLLGGTLRALQTAGALKAALDLSVEYAGERKAFGKLIGKFQAVQINLARLAGEVAAANAAATSAADAIASATTWDEGVFLEAVAAKIRSAEAAEQGILIAHQVHGAIGVTAEHVLHRYTLRAMGWRDDFGSESHWARELGRRVSGAGRDRLWELVASR